MSQRSCSAPASPFQAAVLKDSLILGAAQFVGSNFASWQLAVSGPLRLRAAGRGGGAGLESTGARRCWTRGRRCAVRGRQRQQPASPARRGQPRPSAAPHSRGACDRLRAARGAQRRAPRRQAFGQCSYSCESKLRDDKESNVEQHCRFFLVDSIDDKYLVMFTRTNLQGLRHYDRTTWNTDDGLASTRTSTWHLRSRQQYFELWTLSICCDDTSAARYRASPDPGGEQAVVHGGLDFARLCRCARPSTRRTSARWSQCRRRLPADAARLHRQEFPIILSYGRRLYIERCQQSVPSMSKWTSEKQSNARQQLRFSSDYTGYVADTVNLLLSLCPGNAAAPVGVGCRATDCTGAGTTTACTTCDVANNFYLLNGVCYAYASIPDGYGIVTAGKSRSTKMCRYKLRKMRGQPHDLHRM
jgi:hypothetical protein